MTHSSPPSVVRPAVVYVVLFAAVGAYFPYIAVYFRSIGLPVEAVGLLVALSAATSLVAAPAWGVLADRAGTVRLPLVVAGGIATAGAVWLALARDPVAVALAVVVLSAATAGLAPMLDSRTIELLGTDRDRYGRARAWGSVAFVVVSLVVGALIDRTGAVGLFLVYAPCLVLTSLAAYVLLGESGRRRSTRIGVFSVGDVAGLLRDPSLGLFLVGSILVWTAVTALSTFLSVHLVELGAPGAIVGTVWAIGAVVEVPLMFTFPILARRLGAERLLVVAAVAFAGRAAGVALAPDPLAILLVAPLGGVGFAFFYVGTVAYVARAAPRSVQATAQGIYSGMAFSLGTILGSVIGGQLAGALTLRGLFAAAAIGTLLAALIVRRAVTRPPRRPLTGSPGRGTVGPA